MVWIPTPTWQFTIIFTWHILIALKALHAHGTQTYMRAEVSYAYDNNKTKVMSLVHTASFYCGPGLVYSFFIYEFEKMQNKIILCLWKTPPPALWHKSTGREVLNMSNFNFPVIVYKNQYLKWILINWCCCGTLTTDHDKVLSSGNETSRSSCAWTH